MPVTKSTSPPIQYNNLESIIVPIVSRVPPKTINKNVIIVFKFVSCIGGIALVSLDTNWRMARDGDLNSLRERPSNRTDIL
jgi:hypothetical protein